MKQKQSNNICKPSHARNTGTADIGRTIVDCWSYYFAPRLRGIWRAIRAFSLRVTSIKRRTHVPSVETGRTCRGLLEKSCLFGTDSRDRNEARKQLDEARFYFRNSTFSNVFFLSVSRRLINDPHTSCSTEHLTRAEYVDNNRTTKTSNEIWSRSPVSESSIWTRRETWLGRPEQTLLLGKKRRIAANGWRNRPTAVF